MYIPIGNHIELDRDQRSVRKDGLEVQLTGLEYGLLEYLLRQADRICPRTEILENVWGKAGFRKIQNANTNEYRSYSSR